MTGVLGKLMIERTVFPFQAITTRKMLAWLQINKIRNMIKERITAKIPNETITFKPDASN